MLRSRIRRAALALPAVLSFGAAHAADVEAFEMNAYVDGAGGRAVLAGRLDDAIAEAESARRGTRADALVRATNLCVAYTLERAFDAAEPACKEALEAAKAFDADRGSLVRGRPATAKALSNLGVLQALKGETAEAGARFHEAARFDAWEGAERNLAYLEARHANQRVASRASSGVAMR